MNRQTLRWVRAWAALAVVIVVAILLSRRYHFSFAAELVIYVVAAVTLVRVRIVRKRFPRETPTMVDRLRLGPIARYLLPVGVISFLAGIGWVIAFAHQFPDSSLGVALLFGPSFGLIVLGGVAIGLRVFIWILAD